MGEKVRGETQFVGTNRLFSVAVFPTFIYNTIKKVCGWLFLFCPMHTRTTEEVGNLTTEAALRELVPRLLGIYGDLVDSIILYGSVARGTQTDDSDVDIAVIMRPGATDEMHDRMLDVIVDLELACDKVLSVIRIDRGRFMEWGTTLPFYQSIRREGIILWPAA